MENLRKEIKALEEERLTLTEYGLPFFGEKFSDLYDKVFNAFIEANPNSDGESEFYHVREAIRKIERYPTFPKRDQPAEFSTIRGELHFALKDLMRRVP